MFREQKSSGSVIQLKLTFRQFSISILNFKYIRVSVYFTQSIRILCDSDAPTTTRVLLFPYVVKFRFVTYNNQVQEYETVERN